MVHGLGVREIHDSSQLLTFRRDYVQALIRQEADHLIHAVELEGPIRAVVLIVNRRDSFPSLEHKLQTAPRFQKPGKLW